MKFNWGERRFRLNHTAHRWFAWRPVCVGDFEYAWLEFITRTPVSGGWVYRYTVREKK